MRESDAISRAGHEFLGFCHLKKARVSKDTSVNIVDSESGHSPALMFIEWTATGTQLCAKELESESGATGRLDRRSWRDLQRDDYLAAFEKSTIVQSLSPRKQAIIINHLARSPSFVLVLETHF